MRDILATAIFLFAFAPAQAAPRERSRAVEPRLLAEIAAPISVDLSSLHDEGFAVVGPEGIVDPALDRSLTANFTPLLQQSRFGDGHVTFFDGRVGGWINARTKRFDPEGRIKAFAEGVGRKLTESMPGERFDLHDLDVRPVLRGAPIVQFPHIDGGYLTVTYASIGPGTIVYRADLERGTVQPLVAPTRTLAVISGEDREIYLRRPVGTVHSAPQGSVDRRLMILMRYKMRGAFSAVAAMLRNVRSEPERLRAVLDAYHGH